MKDIEKTSSEFKLNALSWKCQETGLTYGKLRSLYSSKEIQEVYDEYEKLLIARRKGISSEKA